MIGVLPGWDRAGWPIPAFGHHDELLGRSLRLVYDDDLREPVQHRDITAGEVGALRQDGLDGAGAVERLLTRLLAPGPPR